MLSFRDVIEREKNLKKIKIDLIKDYERRILSSRYISRGNKYSEGIATLDFFGLASEFDFLPTQHFPVTQNIHASDFTTNKK